MRLVPILILAAACATDSGASKHGDDSAAGDGDIVVAPMPVVFTDLASGFSDAMDLTVTNNGTGDLAIYQIRLVSDPSGAFEFEEIADIVVPAGESDTWPVNASLPGEDPATGVLRVKSDDADTPEINVDLCAYPAGYAGDTSCTGT